ncbi:MAG: SUMF1/EgtB/PvdO family nonheme iron enzyme, partial [Bacteroidales bacterium]|nr:SUMF1/EgtB/PvdO family nonheme iron enzyme [Bacteroidales bacterium]
MIKQGKGKLVVFLGIILAVSACKTRQVTQKPEPTTEPTKKEWIKTVLVEKDLSKANTVEANFYLGMTEVSQKEYETLMGFNPSGFIGENLPVENLTWYDAAMYCNKLSEKE